MKITLDTTPFEALETEALVTYLFEDGDASQGRIGELDKLTGGLLAKLIRGGEATGKALETTLVHAPAGLKAARLLLIGAGKREQFNTVTLRKAAGVALRYLKSRSVHNFVFAVREGGATEENAQAITEGAIAADFETDKYKTEKKNNKHIENLAIGGYSDDQKAAGEKGIARGRIIADAQNFARDLVNEPGNRMTPTILADRARKMSEETGLTCEIYGPDKLKELKMGAFWSVAQGSDEEPRLIVMRYEPSGAPTKPVLGLVGKGITFDSGGISIKPSDGMEKMKYDMAGGAAMVGAMRAIAQLKPNVRVIGIVCASENMPSGKAQKPGDVQIAMSGKSIEIINTDAEGRLVLADGLHYAKQLGCTHLIDAATLTGACVVALGMVNAGVFANDDEFYDRFNRSLRKSGEKMWRLPVDEEYREMIKSTIADIMNTGGRWGGAVTAAMFLKEFVGDTPWLHLDIAGVAWMEDNKPWIAKGPSGVAVRSIVEFVRELGKSN